MDTHAENTPRDVRAAKVADGDALSEGAFLAALRAQSERYHHRHPFHLDMNEGRLQQEHIQSWVANRYYYQKMIPLKDAAILSNCPFPEIRRVWVQRIIDHDGAVDGQGGIQNWLRLAEAVGLRSEEVLDERYIVPGVRFAVDAYVTFARTRPWIEGVAASLTEMFAPDLMRERLSAFEQHYSWIDPAGLVYLKNRLLQAPRDANHALGLVTHYCRTREQQEQALAALSFKCDVLWSMLDAIQSAPALTRK